MADRNKIKYPSAQTIQRLTQKLNEQGDITPKEADKIYSLFSEDAVKTIFNFGTPEYDRKLVQALEDWFCAVTEKIKAGERGNFIFTVHLDDNFYCKNMYQAVKVIDTLRERGAFEDLCNVIMLDEKFYPAFPFKNLFKKDDDTNTYKLQSPRAGMFYYPFKAGAGTYTISQIMKKFVPFAVSVLPGVLVNGLFGLIFNSEINTRTLWTLGITELKPRVLSSFLKHNHIPCIVAADTYSEEFLIFVEKDKAFIMKKALEVPFEKLVENALYNGVIDQKAARKLLNNNSLFKFPTQKFIDASVKYLDKVVQINMEWKKTREAVEKDNKWLEETM